MILKLFFFRQTIEIGHSQPSDLADDIKSQITKTAEAACMAVGLVNSPAHVEIKVTDEGPKLVELGARMGGDCITTYLINASILGVSMSEEAIRISLGEKRSLGEYRESGIYSAVKFIPSCTGTLKKVIVDQNMDKENVLDIHISVTQGTNYSDARDDTGRFGYVVAKGSSRQEALERCQNIIDAIKFVVDK